MILQREIKLYLLMKYMIMVSWVTCISFRDSLWILFVHKHTGLIGLHTICWNIKKIYHTI